MMYRGPVLFRTGNDHVATPSNLRVEMPEPASTPIRLTLWTLPNKKIFRYPVISEAAGLMKCQSLLVDNGWAPPVVMGTWQFGGFLSLPPLFIYGSYWQLAFALFLKRLSNSMNAFLSVFLKFFYFGWVCSELGNFVSQMIYWKWERHTFAGESLVFPHKRFLLFWLFPTKWSFFFCYASWYMLLLIQYYLCCLWK